MNRYKFNTPYRRPEFKFCKSCGRFDIPGHSCYVLEPAEFIGLYAGRQDIEVIPATNPMQFFADIYP